VEVPETRYARSGEVMIGYQLFGSGEHELLFTGSAAANVETCWAVPEINHFFDRLGRFARVIFFDRRDTGVSDPVRDDLTLEAHVADALAVMDAVGSERPVLVGAVDGARCFAALAASHPDRAGGLVALAPSVRGGADAPAQLIEELIESIASEDYPARMIELFAPDWAADPVRSAQWAHYMRTTCSPKQAQRLLRMSLSRDLSGVLPLVQTPTLVLFPSELEVIPSDAVREFAELIPGAEYREVPGAGTFFAALDPDLLAEVIEQFVTGSAPAPVSNRVLASVLFTDLVGSTERAAQLGDAAWTELLERHHAATRSAVGRHGGETVKTLGDGVLATFTGPARAVRCAEEIIATASAQGLEVRSGVHTGEIEVGDGDISGMAVHLAARIMGEAGPGEILVSRTVRDLVVGSELRFIDRDEHELKGIEEPWHLYAVA
jgi:class 3 adenylate cyclase